MAIEAVADIQKAGTSAFAGGAGGMTRGTALLDFENGKDLASVDVTGQGSITTGNKPQAFFMAESSPDDAADAHILAAALASLVCGAVVEGVGFTIYGVSTFGLTGRYTVQWAY